ncbi:hypothetical protein GCM10017673_03460 [Streptosporangium violaceochromogenes]|nr:hypothetical protein GCM10017673_03460 [Streptosporangium violaceochromogenes]
MKTSPGAVVLALLVTLALGTAFASPAVAHDALRGSDPAKGAKVESLREVKLTFTAKVRFPVVVVHTSDGTPWHEGKAVADGQVVTQRLKDDLPPGGYVIAYRVVSSDGHPIEGEIPFTLTGAKRPSPSATPSPGPSGSPASPGAETAAPPAAEGSPAAVTAAPAAEAKQADGPGPAGGAPTWMWIAFGGVTGVGIGLFLSMRTRKRQP